MSNPISSAPGSQKRNSGFNRIRESKQMARLMLEHGADPQKTGTEMFDGELTTFSALYYAAHFGHLDVCRMLVLNGRVDVNKAEIEGERPLRIAALHGHLPVVQFLVENGAYINGTDGDSFTPLMSAARALNTLVVQILLDRGADKNLRANNGMTAAGFPGTGSSSLGSEALVKLINDHHFN
uniref:Ankyrin repeat protein n=1 Tax=Globodera rostochiensis TaxID=31243 RepID=A0A914H8K7_GLORO